MIGWVKKNHFSPGNGTGEQERYEVVVREWDV